MSSITSKAPSDHPTQRGALSEKDHLDLTAFVGEVLDAYRDGKLDRLAAIVELADLVSAIDTGDLGTFQNRVREGRKRLVD